MLLISGSIAKLLELVKSTPDRFVLAKTASYKSQSINKGTSSAAEQRQLKKDVARLEKQLLKLDEAINALVEEQSSAAFDAERLIEITAKLEELRADKNTKEEEWLFATTALDN